jgi:uncharacterized surface protein with fasciclin (FAS1) repeats
MKRWISRFAAMAAVMSLFVGVASVNASSHSGAMEKPKMDIVDTAASAGSFNTLVAALKAADLVKTLKGKGPYTVFAPTDAAFAKLPKGTLDSLLKPENKAKLQAILTYHVLSGKVASGDIAGKKLSVATVEGSKLSINATKGVMVDKAMVTKADIQTSNGVIHVIDTVILPAT